MSCTRNSELLLNRLLSCRYCLLHHSVPLAACRTTSHPFGTFISAGLAEPYCLCLYRSHTGITSCCSMSPLRPYCHNPCNRACTRPSCRKRRIYHQNTWWHRRHSLQPHRRSPSCHNSHTALQSICCCLNYCCMNMKQPLPLQPPSALK